MKSVRGPGFKGRSPAVQWGALIGASIALVAIAEHVHLPAALLIGPMVAAILVGTANATIRVAAMPYIAAQGVVGCMIGHSIPLSVLGNLAHNWPLFLFGIVSVIAAASALGLMLARLKVLPGTTAIWGTSPGASTSMIIMAEAYGGDIRLVAVMQYLRVICVAFTATLVAKFWVAGTIPPPPAIDWLPPVRWWALGMTLAIAAAAAGLAMLLRIPAGAMLLPAFAVMGLHELTGWTVELPPWLLAVSYAMLGWSIGLRFTRPILMHALRALPAIFASIIVLIVTCGLIAAALVAFAGIDPLTAYLATSPGGLDTIAIIAAASHVDMRFVMAMQTSRLVIVLATCPGISRYLALRQGGFDVPK